MNHGTYTSVMLGCLILTGRADAAEPVSRQQQEAALRSSVRTIDGRKNPELVPFEIRMAHFFARFERPETGYQSELRSKLSAKDYENLMEYSRAHQAAMKADELEYRRRWTEVAASAANMTGVQIAVEMKAAEDEVIRQQAKRYQEALGKLSSDGQAILRAYAFERERPIVMIDDPLKLARTAPEFYKSQILGEYEFMRSGRTLPAVPTDPLPRQTASPRRGAGTDSVTQSGQLGTSQPVP